MCIVHNLEYVCNTRVALAFFYCLCFSIAPLAKGSALFLHTDCSRLSVLELRAEDSPVTVINTIDTTLQRTHNALVSSLARKFFLRV
jgi:hypothetical protein